LLSDPECLREAVKWAGGRVGPSKSNSGTCGDLDGGAVGMVKEEEGGEEEEEELDESVWI
jgi:hypothetical protein